MAFANTDRIQSLGIRARFTALRESVQDAMNRQRVYRQTARELHALNDRELADLGISRSRIPTIAREAANGTERRK